MDTAISCAVHPSSHMGRHSPDLLHIQVLEATALDFSRYGDTLFEVLFAGGRLAAGGNVVEEGKKLDTNVRATLLPISEFPVSQPMQCMPTETVAAHKGEFDVYFSPDAVMHVLLGLSNDRMASMKVQEVANTTICIVGPCSRA